MSSNKRLKIFQRAIARYGLYTTAWLFKRLPYGFVKFITGILLAIGFRCTIRQRRIAEESIDIAFGDKRPPEEKKAIIKKCFKNFGRGMTEMLYYMAHPEAVDGRITIEGKEHLDAAVAKGKGVIAVTAHFGNFALMMLVLARQGYKASSIIRPARDEELSAYLHKKRTEVGLGTVFAIPRRECVSNSLKALRDGGLLFIPIDQNFGSGGGVYVEFFGQKAATATGPAVFAMRTGAAIVPMFILRQEKDRHKIVIEPPIELEDHGEEKETVTATMTKITNLIEQYIRQYPHEWAWMHRRWKSRPKAGG
ncbi:MAG: lysophospholipid acyltransferase family protein [Candidatus Omnitrophica bacterium]|nr:lysophospholipid acyltransferase family protein [Candidatus Omnitrophota bacterium]